MLANCPKAADLIVRMLGFSVILKKGEFGNKAGVMSRKSIVLDMYFKVK